MHDPYLDTSHCVARLWAEYMAHKRLIVAVDFDDTVFDYHKAGHTYDQVILLLQRCQAYEFHIVLFTAAAPDQWATQRNFLFEKHGIKIDAVNENPVPLPFGHHGKIYFNILLDDRAGLGQAVETLRHILDRLDRGNDDSGRANQGHTDQPA